MKNRLNITIEESLLNKAKKYAEQHQTSLSQLIELYLRNLTKKPSRENIITLVEGLKKPQLDPETDLKKQYYEEQKRKHGLKYFWMPLFFWIFYCRGETQILRKR
jgi:hypothetical protein